MITIYVKDKDLYSLKKCGIKVVTPKIGTKITSCANHRKKILTPQCNIVCDILMNNGFLIVSYVPQSVYTLNSVSPKKKDYTLHFLKCSKST